MGGRMCQSWLDQCRTAADVPGDEGTTKASNTWRMGGGVVRKDTLHVHLISCFAAFRPAGWRNGEWTHVYQQIQKRKEGKGVKRRCARITKQILVAWVSVFGRGASSWHLFLIGGIAFVRAMDQRDGWEMEGGGGTLSF